MLVTLAPLLCFVVVLVSQRVLDLALTSLVRPALSAPTFSVTAAVTAGTNAQGQGALTTDINYVTTTAAAPSGVTLPAATVGRRVIVYNRGTNAINVYPASTAAIDGQAVNTPVQIGVGGSLEFTCNVVTTAWQSNKSLYSMIPSNAQTGTTYTLTLQDVGEALRLNNVAAITLTIPTNATVAIPIDTRIDIIQMGAGQVTVGGAGVTIRSSGSKLKLTGQYSGATLLKIATDEWVLIGDITT